MDLGIPLWGVAEVQKMQDAYTDVGGRVMQEQLPSNFLPVQPVHRHSCAVATDSCPLATLIRPVYRPCTRGIPYVLYIKKGKVNFPPQT